MKNYEIMFIIRPTLSEDEVKKVVTNFKKVITDNGSKVTDVKEMGQRELAYEIKKCKSGYYFVFEVEAKDDTPEDKAVKEEVSKVINDIIDGKEVKGVSKDLQKAIQEAYAADPENLTISIDVTLL